MIEQFLYMVLLGATPPGRKTEQHDIFFGIATSLQDLIPAFKKFWPEAKGKIHIDAWRKIQVVDGFKISIIPKTEAAIQSHKLFFLNLGGYKPGEFEEFHYKMVTAATNKAQAIAQAKKTAFYQHCGFEGAISHVDNKYGVDVDDVYEIQDILDPDTKEMYAIHLTPKDNLLEDEMHLGYLKLSVLENMASANR